MLQCYMLHDLFATWGLVNVRLVLMARLIPHGRGCSMKA